jgi:hypothetical protein
MSQINLIVLLDPEMCLECRFSRMVNVERADGSVQRSFFCRRLDCDNWSTVIEQNVKCQELEDK